MSRGGSRPGAGRKPSRSGQKNLSIGLDCERLWRAEFKQAIDQGISDYEQSIPGVRQQWERARKVPKAERQDWAKDQTSLGDDGYFADVRGELLATQGLDDLDNHEPNRFVTIFPKRPWGIRKKIYAQVAAKHGVTPSVAEKYHKLYRRLEREKS